MKCPKCEAKLMPVDGQMFCLQCGTAVAPTAGVDVTAPTLEETVDPLLQRAISDVAEKPVAFLPRVEVKRPAVTSFGSVRAFLAPPQQLVAAGGVGVMAAGGGSESQGASGGAPQGVPAGAAGSGGVGASGGVLGAVSGRVQQMLATGGVAAAKPAAAEAGGGGGIGSSGLAVEQVVAAFEAAKRVGDVVAPVVRRTVASGEVHEARAAVRVLEPATSDDIPGLAWWRLLTGPAARAVAAVGLVVFVVANVALGLAYRDRVYPGVRVGNEALGGLTAAAAQEKVAALAPESKLNVVINTTKYPLDARELGAAADVTTMQKTVLHAGHAWGFPLMGVVQTLFSKPLAFDYVVDTAKVQQQSQRLVAQVDHAATDAQPVIVGGRALVIAEKDGSQLETAKVAKAIAGALGKQPEVNLRPDTLNALIPAAAWQADVDEAQAKMALSLQVKVRTKTYAPSAVEIGNWLSFVGPGKGVALDGSRVVAYVAGLPGTFDRAGAVTALMNAVKAKQPLVYAASTKATAAPKLAAVTPALPWRSYHYCVAGDGAERTAALKQQTAATLGSAGGWSLGNMLAFGVVESGCNFTIQVEPVSQMVLLDPACAGQTTCRLGNELVINEEAWAAVPPGVTMSLEAYRGELINHEVGHWLGFDHASCTKVAATPILSAPTVQVTGCSPNWYAIPVETQDTKVLAGF